MRILIAVAILAAGSGWSAPVLAQSAIEGRVDRLEREMRAVQRRVFPGGAGRTVEPEIVAPPLDLSAPGVPAGSPIANLETRLTSLESQLATLTGQIEQAQYRNRQLEESFEAYKRATDARLTAIERGAATGTGTTAPATGAPAPTPRPAAGGTTTARPPAIDAGRAERIAAVERPATGDAPEDAYVYGYRLWQARLYPEAQAELRGMVAKFPQHRRASYAQNLLGRAYLDEGKPNLAAIAFLENYKKMPKGERAPDSLHYLAQALLKLNRQKEACEAYAELDEVYGTTLSASLRSEVNAGRTAAKCS